MPTFNIDNRSNFEHNVKNLIIIKLNESFRRYNSSFNNSIEQKLDLDIQSLKKIINYISLILVLSGQMELDLRTCHYLNKRITLTKKICDLIKKIPIISGCSFHSFDETFEFLDKTKNFDISGYHYLPYNNDKS